WITPGLKMATIDHAIWWHTHVDANEWLLYVQRSPSASGGRGLTHGQVFDRSGDLVATVTQEGMIRARPKGCARRALSPAARPRLSPHGLTCGLLGAGQRLGGVGVAEEDLGDDRHRRTGCGRRTLTDLGPGDGLGHLDHRHVHTGGLPALLPGPAQVPVRGDPE